MSTQLPVYTRYWAKSDRSDRDRWVSFTDHAAAVTLCALALLDARPHWLDSLCRIAEWPPEQATSAVGFASGGHDIGKLCGPFEHQVPALFEHTYPGIEASSVQFPTDPKDPGKFYHGTGGPPLVEYCVGRNAVKPVRLLLHAAGGHHGFAPKKQRCKALLRRFSRSPCIKQDTEAVRAFWDELYGLYGTGLDLSAMDPERAVRAATLIAGLVVVADHLGSSDYFPHSSLREGLRTFTDALQDQKLRDAAEKAVRDNNFDKLITPACSLDLDAAFNYLGFTPSDMQAFVRTLHTARLVIIEAPTGSGKTEAALLLIYTWLRLNLIARVGIALPTRAVSGAMKPRLDTFFTHLCGRPFEALLSHGTAALERKLSNTGVGEWEWFSRTVKSLLAPTWCATIDQVLLSSLKGAKHSPVRILGITGAGTIFDEIHGADVYMSRVLDEVLRSQAVSKSPTILLSATLSSCQRRRLVAAYLGHDRFQLDKAGYPLVTWVTENGTAHQRSFTPRRPPTQKVLRCIPYRWELDQMGYYRSSDQDELRLLADLTHSHDAGACVGWIRNTVGDAQRVARQLILERPDLDPLVLHAALNGYDRQERTDKLLALLGRGGSRDPVLVIATQILEESYDIDFDRLVRDFAVIDAILQALGRLHRHLRTRPLGFEKAIIEVFMPRSMRKPQGEQFGIVSTIYHGRWLPLLRTFEWLQHMDGRNFLDPTDVPAALDKVFSSNKPTNPLEAAAWNSDQDQENRHDLAADDSIIHRYGHDPNYMPLDDHGERPKTRQGFFYKPLLPMVDAGDWKLRVPHRTEEINLSAFADLKNTTNQDTLRDAIKARQKAWLAVQQVVFRASASRSRIKADQGVAVPGRASQAAQLFRALWQASGCHPKELVLIPLVSDNTETLVERRDRRATTKQFLISYHSVLGLLAEP